MQWTDLQKIILMFQDCTHFAKSILSSTTTTDIFKDLISISNSLYDSYKTNQNCSGAIDKAKNILKGINSWLYSINAFYKKIETTYSDAFPDLAKPLQSSISQTVYSVTSLKDIINELICKIEQGPLIYNIVTDLMVYPNRMPEEDKIGHLYRFVNEKFMNLLKRNALNDKEMFQSGEDLLNIKTDYIE